MSTWRIASVSALLATLVVWTHAHPAYVQADAPDFDTAVPLLLDGWRGRPAPALEPEVARVLAADQYVRRYYGDGTTVVEMDLAYYSRPRVGSAMHSPLNCLPGNGWQVMESRTVPVVLPGGRVDVRRLIVGRGTERLLMSYWFQNRADVISDEYQQRFQILRTGLRGGSTDAALVRVIAPVDRIPDPASRIPDPGFRFTKSLLAVLQAAFR